LEVKEEPKKAEEEEQVRTWHDQAIVLRAKACQLQKGLMPHLHTQRTTTRLMSRLHFEHHAERQVHDPAPPQLP
jgi:hypothetical protein